MRPRGIDRTRVATEPLEHVCDIAIRLSRSADLLDAHIVHVEDAVALDDVADSVDAPDLVTKRAAAAQTLGEIDKRLQRWPHAENDDVSGDHSGNRCR